MNRTRRARVETLVRTVFGLSALRPGQQAVIDAVLSKQHTLAIMPTGAGKSLCYQLPAMLLPGMTVVISPLIALMRDQAEKVTALGLDAVEVNSAVPAADKHQARAKQRARDRAQAQDEFMNGDVPIIIATNALPASAASCSQH